MSRSPATLVGTGLLLRRNLRRDRVLAPAWVVVLTAMVYASASATTQLFGTAAERVAVATALNHQPGLLALYGPILDPASSGELAMSKLTVLYALISTALYVLVVRRHTRVEEETGRAELVGGTVVGRSAALGAAVAEAAVLATLVGTLAAVASFAGGLPVAGSVWFGATWWATGLVATGVGAMACQLSASARTCGSIAAALLGGAYVIRAVGDAVDGAHALVWLSPLGWNTQLRAWSDPRGWVLLMHLALTVSLVATAAWMRGHRDLGAGLVAPRRGRADGRVAGAWTLALRLHRTGLALWTVALAITSLAFGAMAPGFDDLLDGTGGQELVDRLGGTFVAALVQVMAIVVTCFALSVASGLHEDDATGRTGLVLATPTTRARWLAARLVLAVGGAAWLLLVAAVGLTAGFTAAGGSGAGDALVAGLASLPAVWVVAGLAVLAAVAGRPWVGWAAYVLCLALTLVGELLELPSWVVDLSPYSLVPTYPVQAWSWTATLVLLGLAALTHVASAAVLRRRDVD